MVPRMVTCDIPIERETLQVCFYVPRLQTEFGKDPPVSNSIKQCYEKFQRRVPVYRKTRHLQNRS
jgi:hypothetical protein